MFELSNKLLLDFDVVLGPLGMVGDDWVWVEAEFFDLREEVFAVEVGSDDAGVA